MLTIARRLPRVDTLSTTSMLRWCRRLYDGFIEWQEAVSERESLARLDDRLLADIGLTREQQILECSKMLWGLNPTDDGSSIQNRINGPQNW
ncbi:MAG TPA: DUF1127 domain-containing protein [Steroidobacteraceae bacterium]|nr:DUF1127 domain-containing protein [Steroidobacteraceae bacterium]